MGPLAVYYCFLGEITNWWFFCLVCPEEIFVALSDSRIYSNAVIMLSFHLNQMFVLKLIFLREIKIQTVYICRSIEFHECGSHTLDHLVVKESVKKCFVLKSQTLDCRLWYLGKFELTVRHCRNLLLN